MTRTRIARTRITRTRVVALALTAVALVSGTSWALAAWPDPEPARFGAGSGTTEVAAEQMLPVTGPTGPFAGLPSSGASSSGPSSSGASSSGASSSGPSSSRAHGSASMVPNPTAATPGKHATPAPFVQNFAAQPGVTRQKAKRKPTAPVKVAPTIDGCDRNYGTVAHCIPLRFPAGVTDKCAWLRTRGYQNVKVAAKDRQGLDPDRNGIICDN